MERITFWIKTRIIWPVAYRIRSLIRPSSLPQPYEGNYNFDRARKYWANVPRAAGANPLNTPELSTVSDQELVKVFNTEMSKADQKKERVTGFSVASEILKGISRPRVLEYGSGFGFYGIKILLCYPEAKVTFADINEHNLKVIERIASIKGLDSRVNTVLIRNEDASGVCFDETFDLILSMGVLHHTPKAPAIVKNLDKNLKANGHFLAMLYNHEFKKSMSRVSGKKLDEKGFGALSDPVVGSLSNPYSAAYDDREAKVLFFPYVLIRSEYPMPFYNVYLFRKDE